MDSKEMIKKKRNACLQCRWTKSCKCLKRDLRDSEEIVWQLFECINIPVYHHQPTLSVFVTPWTVAHQAPPSMGILQARILEWVAMPSCRGIFPTQVSNTGLLHCRWILHCLSHQGSPRILEWVVCPFSRGSSPPRNQPAVSCIAGGFFTNWATGEDPFKHQAILNQEAPPHKTIFKCITHKMWERHI